MATLDRELRTLLESVEEDARDAAERAVQAVFDRLALADPLAPPSLKNDPLRLQLRERARQLGRGYAEGDVQLENGEAVRAGMPYLREELAYEVWHRMLFARFLAENDLLIHPEYRAAVSIADCAALAEEEGQGRDAWDVAADIAAARLPGLFGAAGLAARLTLAPEEKHALEAQLEKLPARLFHASDALGWVYQYWQKRKKKEVNASERKIGGADLAAVTQLFTEDYMVRFLLENTLGAWWAVRHPESPLIAGWRYLRFRDEEPQAASSKLQGDDDLTITHDPSPITHTRVPAAGTFETWPATAKEVTVIDPCCGSGHFLVAAYGMLRDMRMEEERLAPDEAADAVLRDNLFGLELDPRCTQIATFAVALEAWKDGGEPERSVPHIACSGTPVKGQLKDWVRKFAKGNDTLAYALEQLHTLLKDAPTLGSLIDRRAVIDTADMWKIDWDQLVRVIERATAEESGGDAEVSLFGDTAANAAKAAKLLGGTYTLVATNVPYLTRNRHNSLLADFCNKYYPTSKADLATAFIERCQHFLIDGGTASSVTPDNWLSLTSYRHLRSDLLRISSFQVLVRLGEEAWQSFGIRGPRATLLITSKIAPSLEHQFVGLDLSTPLSAKPILLEQKEIGLRLGSLLMSSQMMQQNNPDERITLETSDSGTLLSDVAHCYKGLGSGDLPRFGRFFWELGNVSDDWIYQQSTVDSTRFYGGREQILYWQHGKGELAASPGAVIRATNIWGSKGILVSQMRDLPVTLFTGESFDTNCAPIIPNDPSHLLAIWTYCSSPDFLKAVRRIDSKVWVTNASLVKVPFDLEYWQKVGEERYPDGFPEPHSDDPTQWLFKGTVPNSEQPLQVAVARLLGYRWPEQAEDGLGRLADPDGIVCLPAVGGEQPADLRLRDLLAAAYGAEWSGALLDKLLEGVGAVSLAAWLRDKKGFFAQHTRIFHNRPFIWQISDGARDGFSALVNHHKFTPAALQKLIYTYLGDWIRTQRDAAEQQTEGAAGRLEKALALQAKLIAIAKGEPPFDIYVRWKPLAEQPIGWEPDLNDGVRLNIRPFIKAGVLHAPFSINWNKDRGKDPVRPTPDLEAVPEDRRASFQMHYSVDRWNDLHFTREEKRAARNAAQEPAAGASTHQPALLSSGER